MPSCAPGLNLGGVAKASTQCIPPTAAIGAAATLSLCQTV